MHKVVVSMQQNNKLQELAVIDTHLQLSKEGKEGDELYRGSIASACFDSACRMALTTQQKVVASKEEQLAVEKGMEQMAAALLAAMRKQRNRAHERDFVDLSSVAARQRRGLSSIAEQRQQVLHRADNSFAQVAVSAAGQEEVAASKAGCHAELQAMHAANMHYNCCLCRSSAQPYQWSGDLPVPTELEVKVGLKTRKSSIFGARIRSLPGRKGGVRRSLRRRSAKGATEQRDLEDEENETGIVNQPDAVTPICATP
eukprot:1174723-Pleurochrysis_carterae.AAC.2